MSFFDRILSLFKTSSNGTSRGTQTTLTTQNTTAVANEPFIIHTVVRIDGMAFSLDLKNFFLIDSGRLITFPLDTPSGLIIGELFGVITFAAQQRPIEGAAASDSGDQPMAAKPQFIAEGETAAAAAEEKVVLPVKNSIFSSQYILNERALSIMGTSDIDAWLEADPNGEPPEVSPKSVLVRIKDNRVTIKFKEEEGVLEVIGGNIFESENQRNKEELDNLL